VLLGKLRVLGGLGSGADLGGFHGGPDTKQFPAMLAPGRTGLDRPPAQTTGRGAQLREGICCGLQALGRAGRRLWLVEELSAVLALAGGVLNFFRAVWTGLQGYL